MKTFRHFYTAALLGCCFNTAYADNSELAKYQQARIAVTYKGNVGELAQQLAEKLGIGYYAVQQHSAAQIKLKQDETQTLQQLLEQVNQQLDNQQLRFDVLNDKVVLALVGNNVSLAPIQFIGNVIYHQEPVQAMEKSNSTEKTVQQPTAHETNQISMPVIDQQITPTEQQPVSKNTEADAKKLQEILALSKNTKLIAQYSKRAQPLYDVPDKTAIGLEALRSTKISTFLIFNNEVDATTYKVEGEFQDMVKLGNVVAILHRQKQPPKEIKITLPNNQEHRLVKTN